MTAADLWTRWTRRRDARAFEVLVRGEVPHALRFARSLGCGAADAEDAVQDALLRLAGSRSPASPGANVRAWLLHAVRERVRSGWRAGRRRRRRETAAAHPESVPGDVRRADARDEVEAFLAALDPADREAVTLRFLHDLDYREIARVVGASETACRIRVHRALGRLRGRFGPSAPAALAALALPESVATASWLRAATTARAPTAADAVLRTGGTIVMSTAKKSALALAALLLLGLGTWIALDTERWSQGADGADDAETADGGRATRQARSGRAGVPTDGGGANGAGVARAGAAVSGSGAGGSSGADGGAASSAATSDADRLGSSPDGAMPEAAPANRLVVRRIQGKVVDAATGEPVGGARVMLAVFDVNVSYPTGSWGSVSESDGSFVVGPSEERERQAERIDVRASAVGYRMEVTHAEEGIIVHLSRRDGPLPRGSLVGTLTRKDGTPLSGRCQVEGLDGLGDYHGIWTIAGRDGRFRIDGLAAGPYRMWTSPSSAETVREVTVVEGAESPLALTGEPTGSDDPARPPRPVRLTGLPKDEGLWIRLHIATAGRQYWQAPVVDGAVEFPAVQLGRWNVVLERDDVEEPWSAIEVTKGDGPFVVEVTAAPK